jgi:hypothetical protein
MRLLGSLKSFPRFPLPVAAWGRTLGLMIPTSTLARSSLGPNRKLKLRIRTSPGET